MTSTDSKTQMKKGAYYSRLGHTAHCVFLFCFKVVFMLACMLRVMLVEVYCTT